MPSYIYIIEGLALWLVVLGNQRFQWRIHLSSRQRSMLLISYGSVGTGCLLRALGISQSLRAPSDLGNALMILGGLPCVFWFIAQGVKKILNFSGNGVADKVTTTETTVATRRILGIAVASRTTVVTTTTSTADAALDPVREERNPS